MVPEYGPLKGDTLYTPYTQGPILQNPFKGGKGPVGLRPCYCTVNSKKLSLSLYPRGILKGIPDLIILEPCANFLEFTVGFDSIGGTCLLINCRP